MKLGSGANMHVGAREGKMVLEISPHGALIGTITNSAAGLIHRTEPIKHGRKSLSLVLDKGMMMKGTMMNVVLCLLDQVLD